MRKLIVAVLATFALAGAAFAQTATPTATPTNTATATVTNTPTVTATRTPTRAVECTTDFCAYHYGSFKADYDGPAPTSFTVTIPGIKPGDLITLQPTLADCMGTASVLTNNVIRATLACAADVAEQDVEYVAFFRSQNNCQGGQNCKRAFTVTPTP